jgi:hypothetical protein
MTIISIRRCHLLFVIIFFCPLFLLSCYETSDETPPFGIYSTSPEDGATNVALNAAIVITFGTDVDPESVTAATFAVKDGAGAGVSGDIDAGGVVADFRSKDKLATNTTYTVTLDRDIQDIYGRTLGDYLGGDYTFSFTTGSQLPEDTP